MLLLTMKVSKIKIEVRRVPIEIPNQNQRVTKRRLKKVETLSLPEKPISIQARPNVTAIGSCDQVAAKIVPQRTFSILTEFSIFSKKFASFK